MNGWTIDGCHTLDDYQLELLAGFKISAPQPRTNYIEIPGLDGVLDASEVFGTKVYDQRDIEAKFIYVGDDYEDAFACANTFINAVHGKKCVIVMDMDASYQYDATLYVDATYDNMIAMVTLTGEAYPYKLRTSTTSVSVDVVEEATVELSNERMPTFPTITVDADMRIVFGDTSIALTSGTYYATDIMLEQGVNSIACYGTGNITFEYQEGAL